MDNDKNRSFFDDEKAENEDFTESIPVPSGEEDGNKPHRIVRYVDVSDNPEDETEDGDVERKKPGKKSFVSDFFTGVAAGAKTVGENIKAGAESIGSDSGKDSDISFSDGSDDEESDDDKENGIKASLGRLSSKTIIIGAALITAMVVAIILCFASCGSSDKPKSENSDELSSGSEIVITDNETDTDVAVVEVPLEIPSRKEKYAEAYNLNSDVVGWLYIPGLSDVDAGVCQDTKKYSYNKRDITGKSVTATYWINGAYYTHLRNTFGASTDNLSTNTVIFGHSDLGLTNLSYKDDDPTGPLFSQLFTFKDPEFAEKTPYIFLTTEAGDTVWEVFSVFYNDSTIDGGKALWYIEPEPASAYGTVLDTMKERSLYNYDVEVTEQDKILTLSTCTVGYGLSSRARYRFVIVAKLIKDTDGLLEKNASFTINEDAPVPDTYREQFLQYVETWNNESSEKTVSE